MEEKSTNSRFFIGLFVVVLCSPFFLWMLLGRYVDSANYENRNLAVRPTFDITSYKSYASAYEAFFNDNLPFRNALISLNSRLKYYFFHTSADDRVIAGKNGWLFYANAADGNPIACYKGENLYSEEQLQAIASNLTNIKEYLAQQGMEFVVFVAPNKERMYPEMMPDFYGEPADNYAALQVVNYVKANTDIRIVYPYDLLMGAKKQMKDIDLYHKVDTHWNYVGGYIGSVALLRELGIEMPEITSKAITITETENGWCDLAAMMNMSKDLQGNEKDYRISGYDDHGVVNEKWDFFTELIYHSIDADPRKIYIVRDSFCSAMSEYIGSQFHDSYMIHSSIYNQNNLLQQSPDIFVLETVERYIGSLGEFDIQKGDIG